MRKEVQWGKGEGSDLENFWVELSPHSNPLSHQSMLTNQLLLAVRRPPMISSSKADMVWGWSVGCGRRVGERRGKRSYKWLWSKCCPENSIMDPSRLNWPPKSFIYLHNWKMASLCILSPRFVARDWTAVVPKYCLHSHTHSRKQPWPADSRTQHKKTTHKLILHPLKDGGKSFTGSFLWESGLFPQPVWYECSTKSSAQSIESS